MISRKFSIALMLLVLCTFLLSGCTGRGGDTATAVPVTEGTPPTTEAPVTTVPEGTEPEAIRVSTVDELLAAIGPDREILLTAGEYNLTQAKGYGRIGGEWYYWDDCYDGYELVITDLCGMTIRGEDFGNVSITTEPRYANVLRFASVSNVTLECLTIGHTQEPGQCAGGVLLFENSTDILVSAARLYGCGIRGVDLYDCRNFHMDCCDIYRCSFGAAYVQGSYNVLFENSKVFDCDISPSLFEIQTSQEVAIINSEIFRNTGGEYGSLVCANCKGVYLGGLDVHDNALQTLITGNFPVTVESCSMQGAPMESTAMFVDPSGRELSERDLREMSKRTVTWTPRELTPVPVPQPDAEGVIHVRNVDEFLAAIGPDRVIYLEPGVYNFSEASGYGSLNGEYYRWNYDYGGAGLLISDVENLTIDGAGADQVTILSVPRNMSVMDFFDTNGLTLRNFTAGHTEEPDACSGSVIEIYGASDAVVESCSLFGCGSLGIYASGCENLNIRDTEIFDCSNGAAWFSGCDSAYMDGCRVHDNGEPTYYADSRCQVWINGCLLVGDTIEIGDSNVSKAG